MRQAKWLVVVVGVTGVGKSTTLERLAARISCHLLPDRRELADQVVLPAVQDELGVPRAPVRDRVDAWLVGTHSSELHAGCLAALERQGYAIAFADAAPPHQPDGLIVAIAAHLRR